MNQSLEPALLLLIAMMPIVSPFSCTKRQVLTFESSEPARIEDERAACVLCDQTPCQSALSAETCGLYDSSSGLTALQAVTAEGRVLLLTYKTCDLLDEKSVFFDFRDPKNKIEQIKPKRPRPPCP